MTRFNTIGYLEPPAAISFFTPAGGLAHNQWGAFVATNVPSGVSLTEQRIRSAFEGAEKELGRYERYLPRWDGYQGEPFPPDVLRSAAAILVYSQSLFLNAGIVPHLVTTGPASDGSIDVELQVADRRLLMTLYPRQEQVRLSSFDQEEAREDVVPLGEQTLDRWVSWLSQPSALQAGVDQNPLRPRPGEAVARR